MPGIDSNTRLMLQLNNDNGVDTSQYIVSTVNSNVTFSNTNPKFTGTYFGVFDGSTTKITAGDTSTFTFLHNSTALFTFECFIKMTSFVDSKKIFDSGINSSTYIGTGMSINADRSIFFAIRRGVFATAVCTGTFSTLFPNDTTIWHHLAITYDQSLVNNNATLFIDGTLVEHMSKTINAPSDSNSTHALFLGVDDDVGFINAKICGVRISNVVRWTADFTPPTAPYSLDATNIYRTLMGAGS